MAIHCYPIITYNLIFAFHFSCNTMIIIHLSDGYPKRGSANDRKIERFAIGRFALGIEHQTGLLRHFVPQKPLTYAKSFRRY